MHCVTVAEWKSVHKRLDDLEHIVKDLKSKLEICGNGNQNLNLETRNSVESNRVEINTEPLISVWSDAVVNLPGSDQVCHESLTLTSEADVSGLQHAPTSSRILTNASASTSIMESNAENVMQGRLPPAASSSSFSIPSGIGVQDQNSFEKFCRAAIISLRRCDETQVLARRASVELRDEQNRENRSTARTIKCTRTPRVARKLAAPSTRENNGKCNGSSVPVGEKRKRYKCLICSRKFTAKYKLTNHARVHTWEKPYVCHICAKRFKYQGSRRVHLRLHTGKKPYACRFCPKAFNGSYDLTRHLSVHTGEKRYQCQLCSKCFSRASNLTLHTHVHTGEKPYQCQFCSKCFSQRNHLTSHTRVHTGEKPYQCQFCSKWFSQSTNLTSYTRIHTGEKPYKCQFCAKTYRMPTSFANHLRAHKD